MKRWDASNMLAIGRKLFLTTHKRKKLVHANHEIHFMAREIDEWLPAGIKSLIDGSYDPRHLKRYYFPDEVFDQVHLSDRILQHILLKELKPTFPHVMNPNCYHFHGPSGVGIATRRIQEVLQAKQPAYIIRADIKSFYASIPHYKLIQDVKQHYSDPKVQVMLENIIRNGIETPRGYRNPDHGIALRGPLSQFFSGLYLKPLDDAFDSADVDYFRYQDDILILCKTKRSLKRCQQRMLHILKQRDLKLSGKKTRIGAIDRGFHFLGIDYLGTQIPDNTNTSRSDDNAVASLKLTSNLASNNEHTFDLIREGGGVVCH